MTRIMLLIGSLATLAAGTASAQSSVSVSIGFGVPRPYLAGTVFVGRPHMRPMYRPYLHRFPPRRVFVPRPRAYRPLLVVPCPRGSHWRRGAVGWRFDRD